MPEQITFRGSVLWDDSVTGAGWSFTPGATVEAAIEAKAPLGDGYWIKPAGRELTSHSLELTWLTSDPGGLRAAVQALASATLGTLVVPGWGSFSRCRLSGVGNFTPQKSEGAKYLVSTSLTFTQYP